MKYDILDFRIICSSLDINCVVFEINLRHNIAMEALEGVLNPKKYFELNIQEVGREACHRDKVFTFTPKSYHLFHYVISGEGVLEYKDKTYHLKANQMFYIAPGDRPFYHPNPDNPWTYIWVGFDGVIVPEILNYANISSSNPIFNDVNKEIKALFSEMHSARIGDKRNTIYALGSLYQVLFYLVYYNKGPEIENNYPLMIIEARDFIMNNYQFNISIDDIASSVSVTPNYLSNMFKKYMGVTVKKYLNSIRIERACALLSFTEMPIKDISEQVSFKNQLQFATLFKKFKGVTPSEYRKMNRV